MRANVRFMVDESGLGQEFRWKTLDYLEKVENPIIPPIGGSYRNGTGKYRVNEIDYGYMVDTSEFEDGEAICVITVEVS